LAAIKNPYRIRRLTPDNEKNSKTKASRKPQLFLGKAIERIDVVCVYAGDAANARLMFG
jgi:hypothetical protein